MARILVFCLIAGCGFANSPEASPGSVEPGPTDSAPPRPRAYTLVTQVDLTVEAILPDQAEQVVATLRELSTNPAHALITLADEAGVPAVGTLYNLLPGVLRDRLEGWINDEIAKVSIGGMPITDYADHIAGLAATALTHVALDSQLVIHGATATHRLTALDLTPAGLELTLPIGGFDGDAVTQETSATIAPGGALALGDQHFGFAYGEYAWQGVEAASRSLFGAGVRDALGNAINCPRVAHSVATRCVLGVCVGHEAELTTICNGGLDAIVGLARDRVAALRLDALHFSHGQAIVVDGSGDHGGDTITGGVWQADLDLGFGPRHAPATFTGGN